jgi:hypothetical protein
MDNEITVEYTLMINGDKLKGKGAAEFGGQKQEFDIEGEKGQVECDSLAAAQRRQAAAATLLAESAGFRPDGDPGTLPPRDSHGKGKRHDPSIGCSIGCLDRARNDSRLSRVQRPGVTKE